MAAALPQWTNRLPLRLAVGALMAATGVVAAVWYYFTPKYTRVGYRPIQPVPFSHAVHVDQGGLDCRYCHAGVEESWYAGLPPTEVCIRCHGPRHGNVLGDDPRLAWVRHSAETGEPIPWIAIHRLPDYAYFHHAAHVRRGVSCVECHGPVHQMDEVYHAQPLSMAFCLDCHRNPASRLRPPEKVFDLAWRWHSEPKVAAQLQSQFGRRAVAEWAVEPRQSCSPCHR